MSFLIPWWQTHEWMYWFLALILGCIVGASELISRYRDEPYQQLKLMALAFGFLNLTGERNFHALMQQLASYEQHTKNHPRKHESTKPGKARNFARNHERSLL